MVRTTSNAYSVMKNHEKKMTKIKDIQVKWLVI